MKRARKPPNGQKTSPNGEQNKEQNQSTVKAAEGSLESLKPEAEHAAQFTEAAAGIPPRAAAGAAQVTAPRCTRRWQRLCSLRFSPARARWLLLPGSALQRVFEEIARRDWVLFHSETTHHAELSRKTAPRRPGKLKTHAVTKIRQELPDSWRMKNLP